VQVARTTSSFSSTRLSSGASRWAIPGRLNRVTTRASSEGNISGRFRLKYPKPRIYSLVSELPAQSTTSRKRSWSRTLEQVSNIHSPSGSLDPCCVLTAREHAHSFVVLPSLTLFHVVCRQALPISSPLDHHHCPFSDNLPTKKVPSYQVRKQTWRAGRPRKSLSVEVHSSHRAASSPNPSSISPTLCATLEAVQFPFCWTSSAKTVKFWTPSRRQTLLSSLSNVE
jgi:hypothetical protein